MTSISGVKSPAKPLDYAARANRALSSVPSPNVLSSPSHGGYARSQLSEGKPELVEVAENRRVQDRLSQSIECLVRNGACSVDIRLSVFTAPDQVGTLMLLRLLQESCETLRTKYAVRGCRVEHSFAAVNNQYSHPTEIVYVGVHLAPTLAPF